MSNEVVTIEELPINPQAKLTSDIKSSLIKIIENEFNNQATVFDSKANKEREKIIDEHKKKVGFQKLCDQIKRAEHELQLAKDRLSATGLNEDGGISGYGYGKRCEEGAKQGQQLLDKIEKIVSAIRPATNYKNKVITRMLTASNYGEAMVIMQSVLGNGVLPSMTLKQLTVETVAK